MVHFSSMSMALLRFGTLKEWKTLTIEPKEFTLRTLGMAEERLDQIILRRCLIDSTNILLVENCPWKKHMRVN